MGIQERDYYQDLYSKKDKKSKKREIFVWIIIVIVILGLITSLLPPINR